MRLKTVIIVLLLGMTIAISPALALDSSSSIQTKLDQLKAEIASKAARLKTEVNLKLQNKAYIGTVITKSPTSLNLALKSGSGLIRVNQDTIFDSTNKKIKNYSLKNLATQDSIAALGDVDDDGVLTAKKVILLQPIKVATKSAVWGQVLSTSDKLITIKNKELKNVAVSVSIQTIFKKGDQELILSSLKNNDFVIVSGVINKNDILEASFVYILPQGILLKPKTKPATPSATGVSSPSAKTKK